MRNGRRGSVCVEEGCAVHHAPAMNHETRPSHERSDDVRHMPLCMEPQDSPLDAPAQTSRSHAVCCHYLCNCRHD